MAFEALQLNPDVSWLTSKWQIVPFPVICILLYSTGSIIIQICLKMVVPCSNPLHLSTKIHGFVHIPYEKSTMTMVFISTPHLAGGLFPNLPRFKMEPCDGRASCNPWCHGLGSVCHRCWRFVATYSNIFQHIPNAPSELTQVHEENVGFCVIWKVHKREWTSSQTKTIWECQDFHEMWSQRSERSQSPKEPWIKNGIEQNRL